MAIVKRRKEDPAATYVKQKVVAQLLKEGHRTFANWLANPKLYLRLVSDPEIVAAICESTGEIYLNSYFTDMQAISMLLRHELLHKMFKHEEETMKILAQQLGLSYDTLDDLTLGQLRQLAYAPTAFEGSLQNIVGDYHLSQYYTNLDREYVQDLDFYGESIKGLLIDQLYDDNPYGVKLNKDDVTKYSFEDLYNKFDNAYKKIMWDAYEHVYGEEDENGEFVEAKPSHDLYIGVNNGQIIALTDEQSEAKSWNGKVGEIYHLLIPDYLSTQIENDINNNSDKLVGMRLEKFKDEFKDFPLELVDGNLNVINGEQNEV